MSGPGVPGYVTGIVDPDGRWVGDGCVASTRNTGLGGVSYRTTRQGYTPIPAGVVNVQRGAGVEELRVRGSTGTAKPVGGGVIYRRSAGRGRCVGVPVWGGDEEGAGRRDTGVASVTGAECGWDVPDSLGRAVSW